MPWGERANATSTVLFHFDPITLIAPVHKMPQALLGSSELYKG